MSDRRTAWTVLLCGVALAVVLSVQQLSPPYIGMTQPEYLIARRWGYAAMGLLVVSGAILVWTVEKDRR